MEFEELYQEIILDHYKHPHNFGEGQPTCTAVELDNPVCGDHIKLMLEIDEKGIVKDVKFSGGGCAISVASASIMTDEIKGKSVAEVEKIVGDVLKTLRGEQDPDSLDEYGDLVALKGVTRYPVRVKCATLSWHAVQDAIKKIESKK
ncbi:MAG: SUF system NifU family Fe-S cluster assembly protein [Calditrichia bacterium]